MDQFLSEYYGTADEGFVGQEDELEKMAQLTLLTKEAAAEGIDLNEFTDEEVLGMAEELYGNGEMVGEEDMEKEAAAKFEEADFLGRVMAHSFNQELGNIEKEAGKRLDYVKGLPGRAYQTVMGKPSARVGEAARGKSLSAMARMKGEGETRGPTRTARMLMRLGGKGGGDLSDIQRANLAAKRLERAASVGTKAAIGTGLVAGTGGAAYGGYKGVEAMRGGKKKKGADGAFDHLVEQRALEHLEAAGYDIGQEKTAGDDFEAAVDTAALELLQSSGYPVEWY